jgi:integral membrane sensor domain MASE1
MTTGSERRDRASYAVTIGAIAAAYYATAKLGLDLASANPSVTAIWPPTGISLAALVLLGRRYWPGVALGAFLANAWTGVPLVGVLGITAGNTLEAVVGASLLMWVGFRPALDRVRDVLALVVLGAIASTMVSASIGVTSLLATDEIVSADLGSVWRTWWLGDLGGDLVVAPAILIGVALWPYRGLPGGALEAVLLALGLGGVTALVFTESTALVYVIFPLLIWAGYRFLQPGAAASGLVLAAVAIPLTDRGYGPWADYAPDDRLVLAQTFVGVAVVTTLIFAAVIRERLRAEGVTERIADTLQESLLPPRLPAVPGLDVAADFRPAGEPNLVGGDFYDLFSNDDGSWLVVVGDVCGKGVNAARLTGLARYTLRAAALREHSPRGILNLLNAAIVRHSPERFSTAAVARLDRNGAGGIRLTLANGGHPLPLVLRAGGEVERVGTSGMLLGAVDTVAIDEQDVDLAPGDAVVFFTDGLTDAHAPGRIVGPADLASIVAGLRGRSASEIVAGLRAAILDDGGGKARDDAVVLVLRVSAV